MLQVSDLSKGYADALLFQKVSFVVNAGDRVGMVGPNGCGKSTLLRILCGQERPDGGSIRYTVSNPHVGYLPQGLLYDPGALVRDVLRDTAEQNDVYWAERVQELAQRLSLAEGAELEIVEDAYSEAIDRLEAAANLLPQHEIQRVLSGLDLDRLSEDTLISHLSGGQKTRLGLARILLAQRHHTGPSLLLLDEPTNHLDITALAWLEAYLRAYEGALLLVSHDRAFLDNTVTRILEMDAATHAVTLYEGNYTAYAQRKQDERAKLELAYKNQQARLGRLQTAIRGIKGQASRIEQETIDFHYRKQAKKIARRAIVQQRRLERMIESEDHLDKPGLEWQMKLEFVQTPPSGQDVLVLDQATMRYGDLLLFEDVDLILRRQERVALIGPNGSGKSTLLRIIAGEEQLVGGSVRLGANVRVGYLSQEQDNLDWEATPLDIIRREAALSETDARSFLHYFLFSGDDVFKRTGDLSFGERARLALGVLVLEGCNLLLLDEPINHLDIPSRERFERSLAGFEGTVLCVVHDRYFIAGLLRGSQSGRIWALHDHSIHSYVDLEEAGRMAGW